MTALLQFTAWPMEPPAVYGPFHLLFFILGTFAAVTAARLLAEYYTRQNACESARAALLFQADVQFPGAVPPQTAEQPHLRVLFVCGIILGAGEIYKQLFNYYIVNNGHFNPWYIPFQLCSLPVYLCLILPFIHRKSSQTSICTFLLDFNLMGAFATFIDPSDLMHPYLMLTLHGFIWHLLLIFIGFYVLFSQTADTSRHGFIHTLPLFFGAAFIAEIINTIIHLLDIGETNLFYISPYDNSSQLVFGTLDQILGRPLGIIIYMGCMIGAAGVFHWISSIYVRRSEEK